MICRYSKKLGCRARIGFQSFKEGIHITIKVLQHNHSVSVETADTYHEYNHLPQDVEDKVIEFINVKGSKPHIRRHILGKYIYFIFFIFNFNFSIKNRMVLL